MKIRLDIQFEYISRKNNLLFYSIPTFWHTIVFNLDKFVNSKTGIPKEVVAGGKSANLFGIAPANGTKQFHLLLSPVSIPTSYFLFIMDLTFLAQISVGFISLEPMG